MGDGGGYVYERAESGSGVKVSGLNASTWEVGDDVGRENASCVVDIACPRLTFCCLLPPEKRETSQLIAGLQDRRRLRGEFWAMNP